MCDLVPDLDFVEVLSGIEGHYVVGGDADDGFVSRVPGPVKGQSRLSWDYLEKQCTQTFDALSRVMSVTLVCSAPKLHVWYNIRRGNRSSSGDILLFKNHTVKQKVNNNNRNKQ